MDETPLSDEARAAVVRELRATADRLDQTADELEEQAAGYSEPEAQERLEHEASGYAQAAEDVRERADAVEAGD
jgi:hypothetical protein